MAFNRQPRIQAGLPIETIKIPNHPALPPKPDSGNWLTVLLPLGAVLLSVVLMVGFMGSGGSGMSYLIFIPVMLVSYVAAFITTGTQKKSYQKKVEESRKKFRGTLRGIEEQLQSLQKKEAEIRLENDPDLGKCQMRVQTQDARLGERRVSDEDFLCPRIGLGTVPSTTKIEFDNAEDIPEEFKEECKFVDQLVVTYSEIQKMPVTARLGSRGSIGIAGGVSETKDCVRGIIGQILTNHWPAEVTVGVICKEMQFAEWMWLQDIPHSYKPLQFIRNEEDSDKTGGISNKNLSVLENELQRREQMVEAAKLVKKDQNVPPHLDIPLPRLIVVFDHLDPNFVHPALTLLHRKGLELGIHGVFLADQVKQIPGSCGAILELNNNQLVYEETSLSGMKRTCVPDRLPLGQAEVFANAFKNIAYPGGEDGSQPPDMITFLQLFGVSKVEELPLARWWNDSSPWGYLRAPIGKISKTSDLIFDLNDRDGSHGPHGLLGGMTGSGKSEVLKAIILALAVTHHPYDLNFALIDFKGGAAFNELSRLPHTVGIVTDIESNATFAERVILALSGEIERRKRVLEIARAAFRFGRSHIDDYLAVPVRRPLPRLVIVFDEFAEFKQRNPAEAKKLISIARQGRSLGVHLILATQNIEAAVDPEIMQNSTFKICLKVSDPKDSMQMVGIPDAINLTRGKGYFSANTRVMYQSAFSGAPYKSERKKAPSFTKIAPDGQRVTIDLPVWGSPDKSISDVPPSTEASAVVEKMIEVARQMHLKKPQAVWPEALPDRMYLPEILNSSLTGGWDGSDWNPCCFWGEKENQHKFISPILGRYDNPIQQTQPLVEVDIHRGGGHLLVFGSSGSGKSTLLRSLVTSLALTHPPTDVNIYILDYGGQSSLKPLEMFPHVGAVVTRLEKERTERLIQFIHSEVVRRNELLRSAHVDSWIDYNAGVAGDQRLPALYLLIDGFRDLKTSFEIDFINEISSLVSGGQAAGLYMIVSSSLQGDVPNELFANINTRVTFNQADSTEYYRIIGQPSEAKIQEDAAKGVRPGRGMLRGTPPLEFQAALPAEGSSDKEQVENLTSLASRMRMVWQVSGNPVPVEIKILPLMLSLPDVELSSKENYYPLQTVFGSDFEALAPTGLALDQDGPTFLVTGVTHQSGKTTFLQTWLLSLASKYPTEKLQINVIDFHSRSLAGLRKLPHVSQYIGSAASMQPALDKLTNEIQKRRQFIEKPMKPILNI